MNPTRANPPVFPFRELPCHSVAHDRAPTQKILRALRVFVLNPTARPTTLRALRLCENPRRAPTSSPQRASITITSTAALSTSTTDPISVNFRVIPWPTTQGRLLRLTTILVEVVRIILIRIIGRINVPILLLRFERV